LYKTVFIIVTLFVLSLVGFSSSVAQSPAVLEGPVCAENMAWWKVQYQGQTGWTAEGQGTDYWLEPLTW
jgi:ABC-type antimicrobial peptide transport system permease subunit